MSHGTPLTMVTSVTPAKTAALRGSLGPVSVHKLPGIVGISTATGSSAGLLAHFAAASRNTVAVAALTVIIVSAVIISGLPKILAQLPAIHEKKVLSKEAKTRRMIAKAGLERDKTDEAVRLLRQLAINPASPKDQRLSDGAYRELLKLLPPELLELLPSQGKGDPPKDEGDPPGDEGGRVVVPFPSDL